VFFASKMLCEIKEKKLKESLIWLKNCEFIKFLLQKKTVFLQLL